MISAAPRARRGTLPRPLLGAALALLTAAHVAAEEGMPAEGGTEALTWLDRMAQASRELNYDGIFVYRHGNEMETMRVIHRGGEGGELERLVSLNGAPREVLRDASQVTCIRTDNRSVMIGPSHSRGVLASVFRDSESRFTDHYDLRLLGRDRVAGRTARKLAITPRDAYRYGYLLWLHEDTGFPLRSELRHPDGTPLEQLVYTTLRFPDRIPDRLLEPSVSGDNFVWLKAEASDSATPPPTPAATEWRVGWLPEGFRIRQAVRDPVVYDRRPVHHMVYSDGLASFSVYLERLESEPDSFEGSSRMGAVNAFGRVVDGHQVTVVGEVPLETVRRVAAEVGRAE
jgi:sigma-E factor negative regulatory protein RseB